MEENTVKETVKRTAWAAERPRVKSMVASFAAAVLLGQTSLAEVTLVDKDDWKVNMYGFLENDFIRDSTRSFTDLMGNGPVALAGTVNGDNGRTQTSVRNSRLGFSAWAPAENGWRPRGVLELDFFGFNPGPSTNPIAVTETGAPGTVTVNDTTVPNTEAAYYQNPVPRVRHAYASLESDNWKFLFGHTWSLFGWQPTYVPTSVSIVPLPGNVFQRTAQILAINTIKMGESSNLQWGLSLERPSQRDSQMPNVAYGIKYSLDSWKAGFANFWQEEKAVPASIALSGNFKQFQAQGMDLTSQSQSKVNSAAYAVDLMLPLIPASADDTSNALTLTAEYAAGTGFGDALLGWTGGFKQLPSGAPTGFNPLGNTNLDAGQGYFDNNGNFSLLQLQTYLVNLQYHLPKSVGAFIVAGYGVTKSTTIDTTISTTLNAVSGLYSSSTNYYVSYWQNITKTLRLAVEWDHTKTQYADAANSSPSNDRVQFSTYIGI
ncbi:MAG: hypothetical protein C5B49_07845 [Bdellovibrio sp.]|nr:MAG: hypothetical protein C5B49_07845 [Bdellovibrio sp.]